ncbi:hypothetical protein [Pseudomonas sp. B21-040]|nr:hypothetical protein [Pseudomonas sp. B21-040]
MKELSIFVIGLVIGSVLTKQAMDGSALRAALRYQQQRDRQV